MIHVECSPDSFNNVFKEPAPVYLNKVGFSMYGNIKYCKLHLQVVDGGGQSTAIELWGCMVGILSCHFVPPSNANMFDDSHM